MLHEGEKLKLDCPSYLGPGGQEIYSNVDDGFKIPSQTPLTMELEVIQCKNPTARVDFNADNSQFNLTKKVKPALKGEASLEKVVGSGLKFLAGSNTHNRHGEVRREGGGESAGWSEDGAKIVKPVTVRQVEKARISVKTLSDQSEKLTADEEETEKKVASAKAQLAK
jgi:hypothetical protein